MALRWTKDLLAVIVVAVFCLWVVVSALLSLTYSPLKELLYGPNGASLVVWDFLAAVLCLFAYFAFGWNLPERVVYPASSYEFARDFMNIPFHIITGVGFGLGMALIPLLRSVLDSTGLGWVFYPGIIVLLVLSVIGAYRSRKKRASPKSSSQGPSAKTR